MAVQVRLTQIAIFYVIREFAVSGQPLDSSHVQTEDDVHVRPSAPLPDVVPFQRNRSASLPVVQPLRQSDEETVGRTLRRISDEFEFYHRERRVCTCSTIV